MTDSVNLNPFVSSSSIIEYKKSIEKKNAEETKSSHSNAPRSSEDMEPELNLDSSADNKDILSAYKDKIIGNFANDLDLNIAYQIMTSTNNNWETDTNDLNKLYDSGQKDLSQYKTLISKAMDDFLAQYTGDSSNIESEFKSYITNLLKQDNGLKSLTQKYNNEEILRNAQRDYDEATSKLNIIVSSNKNDKKTQVQKSHLELVLRNLEPLLKKSTKK